MIEGYHCRKDKSVCRPERNRKQGLDLSEDTVRKLSALLWNNETNSCSTNDCGVKSNEASSFDNLQQKIPTTDEDHKNTACRNGRKDCIMEINGNHCETNNVCSIVEEQNKGFAEKSVLKQNEMHVEVLHHGRYCI